MTRTLAGVATVGTVLVLAIAIGVAFLVWALFEAVGHAPSLEDEASG